jgi:penicillin-binding protein 1B
MTSLMEEVLRSGTGAGARGRGFVLPAAGKTGTSHDGWFAGYTTKLICVVWVGFDDNRELVLEGAQSALPIWTEFMKRAHEHREYATARGFEAPDGIVAVEVDPSTGQLATSACPNTRNEMFIAGSQPAQSCPVHRGGSGTRVASWDVPDAEPPAPSARSNPKRLAQNNAAPPVAEAAKTPEPPRKPKGIFGKLRDMFK